MKNQLNLSEEMPIWKLILVLAWPAVVEQLLQTAVNYVDTAMVGNIGVTATAAIGVTSSTIWMLNGFMNAVGVGFSVQVARSIGAGALEDAREIIRQAVLAIIVLGIGLTLLAVFVIAPNLPVWMHVDAAVVPLASAYMRIVGAVYLFNISMVVCSNILRCAGDTKTPMKYNILTNVINVIGNFFLIYPSAQVNVFGYDLVLPRTGLGVVGAAVATAISIFFSGTCMALVLFRGHMPIRISLTDTFRPKRRIIMQATRLGVPVAMERMTISLGHIVSTAIISDLGTLSLAAHQLASAGESLCYLPANGFSIAGTTSVAQYLGAGEHDKAYQSGKWAIRLAVAVMIFTSTAMFLFAVPIMDLFSNEHEVIQMGAKMLRIEAYAEPLLATGIVIAGILHGAGDNRWPFYISIIGMWIVRLPVACLMISYLHWGLTSIWVAMIVDWFVRAALSYWRFYRRRWLLAWK